MSTFETLYQELQKDEAWINTMKYLHKGKDIEQGIREAYGHLIADDDRHKNSNMSDFKRLVNSWLSNKRFPRENAVKVKRDLSNL